MAGKVFKNYYSRLAREGVLKALMCGLIVGSSAMFITAFISWIANFNALWICVGLFVGLTAASTPVFYFKLFRPSKVAIAKRIDELGLEERLLTMTELEGDTSFMAMKQREDAMKALETVSPQSVKIAVSLPVTIALAVTFVLGTLFCVLTATVKEKVLPPIEHRIVYTVEGEGLIYGSVQTTYKEVSKPVSALSAGGDDGSKTVSVLENYYQLVEEGKDAAPVMAVAKSGWSFVCWSDGVLTPYREDVEVLGRMDITAIFKEVTLPSVGAVNPFAVGNGDGDLLGGGGAPGDETSYDPSDAEGETDPQDVQASDRADLEANQVFDGKHDYGNEYGNERNGAMDKIDSNGNMSDGRKEFVGDYYDAISNGGSN